MKKVKSFITVILALLLTFSCCSISFADAEPSAKLYSIYGDGMLFQHNKKAVISGTAKGGTDISYIVKDSDGKAVAQGSGKAESDNTFAVSFDAPDAGYEEYTIEMYQNGNLFTTIKDVVFGELWLASGQSNMHIFLRFSKDGIEMVNKGETGSENIRILDMPLVPGYSADRGVVGLPGNTTNCPSPLKPQKDIYGANWFKGNSTKIYDITALGYFFACKLQKELDMPVGILCDYLGGSGITPWLSREAIDSDKTVKSDLGLDYISEKKWDETADYNNMTVMTTLYNKKTAPLTAFNIAGMIWYQGESDCSWHYGRYTRAIELLQNSLTKEFKYDNGKLPVIAATFADYSGGSLNSFRLLGAELGDFAKADYSSRAAVSLSDLPLEYTDATQAIHPYDKKPVGERMADSAISLVYKKNSFSPSSPIIDKAEIKEDGIYIKFSGCCDGLICPDKAIHGFTICSKNGVYVPAKAEIISKDTVRVYSENVKKPVAAMYSQGQITGRSNLFSSVNGQKYMPVCHTVTDREYTDNIWQDCGWTDCDCDSIWHQESLTVAGYYKTWNAENATVKTVPEAAYSGDAGLSITSDRQNFSINPASHWFDKESNKNQLFANFNTNLKGFTSFSVMLKNDGKKDVTLDKAKIFSGDKIYFCPRISGTKDISVTVPNDGKWHKVTFDLDNLQINGKKMPFTFTRRILKNVTDIKFEFSGEGTSQFYFDDVQFAPYTYGVSLIRIAGLDIVTMIHRLFTAE